MASAVAIGTAVILTVAVGAAAIAQDDGEADPGPPPPAGVPEAGQPAPRDGEVSAKLITTSGTTYDPTILTKFIAGSGFAIHQGLDPYQDVADYRGGANATCVRADSAAPDAAGTFIDLNASVELPDGARIKRVKFYGENSDPADSIEVRLHRLRFTVPVAVGPVVRTDTNVNSFSVPASSGVTAILGTDDLDEIAGSQFISAATGTEHNFHSVRVRMDNSAGSNQRLCGVEVEYQVPVTDEPGTVFHPLAGYRAYDSRFEMAPVDDGPLGAGPGRVIPVKDGRNVGTGVIDLPDAIPSTATAVAYTLTVAGPTSSGFLFIAPGDAGSITASSINWDSNTSGALANSGIVQLDGEREVIVFADGNPGASTQFIIDITGYYAPAEFPNMAN
ncbi:MAG: hypothetical protein ACR2O6_03700 [Ilumatobacteraceae bacterium]